MSSSAPPPDLRPRWVSAAPEDPHISRGLLDQLIETGLLEKALVMPDSIYTVVTRFTFRQDARLFRTVVLRDGTELRDGAWSPIFRDRTAEIRNHEGDHERRIELAREALECHLSLVSRLAQDLQVGRASFVSKNQVKMLLMSIGFVLVVGALIYREELRSLLAVPDVAVVMPQEQAAGEPVAAPVIDDSESGIDSNAIGVGEQPAENVVEPAKRAGSMSERFEKPSASVPSSRAFKAPEEKRQTPNIAKEELPVSKNSNLVVPPEDGGIESRIEADRSEKEHASTPIGGIMSATHYQTFLEHGNSVYDGEKILFSEFPDSLRGHLCVTSGRSAGNQDGDFVFELLVPATLWIAHDRRIKKKPDWLDSFTPSGNVMTAHVVDEGDSIVYDLFYKRFSRGSVILGPNTLKNSFNFFREISSKRKVMYLVCVE